VFIGPVQPTDGQALWINTAVGAPPPSTLAGQVPVFIQDAAPTAEQLNGATKYVWHQTSGGTVTATWIETGGA
jgi:hypothetical protein